MWSEEQSLELIGLYREKPVLWNPQHPQYFKKVWKNDAWVDIARSVERDAEVCSNKMISILASYRRERGRARTYQGTGKGNFNF